MVKPTVASVGLPPVLGDALHTPPTLKLSILLALGPTVVTTILTPSVLLVGTVVCVVPTVVEPVPMLTAAQTLRLFLHSSPPCLLTAPLNLPEPRTPPAMQL